MAVKKDEPKKDEAPTYVVMNPRALPEGVPVITIDDEEGNPRHFYEGDTYDGPRPEEFREEGVLVTQKQAEQIVKTLDKEADAGEQEGSE